MDGAHVTGGAFGAAVGAVLAPLLARYGVDVTDSTASLIGVAAASLGVGLGHVVSKQGIWPAIKRAFVGPQKAGKVNPPAMKPAAVTVAPVASQTPPTA